MLWSWKVASGNKRMIFPSKKRNNKVPFGVPPSHLNLIVLFAVNSYSNEAHIILLMKFWHFSVYAPMLKGTDRTWVSPHHAPPVLRS